MFGMRWHDLYGMLLRRAHPRNDGSTWWRVESYYGVSGASAEPLRQKA